MAYNNPLTLSDNVRLKYFDSVWAALRKPLSKRVNINTESILYREDWFLVPSISDASYFNLTALLVKKSKGEKIYDSATYSMLGPLRNYASVNPISKHDQAEFDVFRRELTWKDFEKPFNCSIHPDDKINQEFTGLPGFTEIQCQGGKKYEFKLSDDAGEKFTKDKSLFNFIKWSSSSAEEKFKKDKTLHNLFKYGTSVQLDSINIRKLTPKCIDLIKDVKFEMEDVHSTNSTDNSSTFYIINEVLFANVSVRVNQDNNYMRGEGFDKLNYKTRRSEILSSPYFYANSKFSRPNGGIPVAFRLKKCEIKNSTISSVVSHWNKLKGQLLPHRIFEISEKARDNYKSKRNLMK